MLNVREGTEIGREEGEERRGGQGRKEGRIGRERGRGE
jgi:hypothetical protein